uniref:Uncharacterized protein n=1 Tax=Cuerna arida TaxID=1464854 RepID=A0A1B6FS07_9HEMI
MKLTYYSNSDSQRLKVSFLHYPNQFEMTGNTNDKETAIRYKKQYDNKLKELRKLASDNMINKTDNKTKALWYTINKERKTKSDSPQQLKIKIDEDIISDPTTIANIMNNYFVTIADRTLTNTTQNDIQTSQHSEITSTIPEHTLSMFTPTNHAEIENIIKSIKPKTPQESMKYHQNY